MTYSELFEICCGELPGDISVDVSTWRYDDGRKRQEWRIWVAQWREHYSGPTAESALAAARAQLALVNDKDGPCDLAAVDAHEMEYAKPQACSVVLQPGEEVVLSVPCEIEE